MPAAPFLSRLALRDFRCHQALDMHLAAGVNVLTGGNGAGKTSILEAISCLTPGRSLLGRPLRGAVRSVRGGAKEKPAGWKIAAFLHLPPAPVRLAAVYHQPARHKTLTLGGKRVSGKAARVLRLIWLTPEMEKNIGESQTVRRRFLDRLAAGLEPDHAAAASRYDRLARARRSLLRGETRPDPLWLSQIEAELAQLMLRLTQTRLRAARDLTARLAIDGFAGELALTGRLAELTRQSDGAPILARQLEANRPLDRKSGRQVFGVHSAALVLRRHGLDIASASTGERKMFLAALLLAAIGCAQARSEPLPVILLDEIAAHLDGKAAEKLFAAFLATGAQLLLTGQNAAQFKILPPNAHFFAVSPSCAPLCTAFPDKIRFA